MEKIVSAEDLHKLPHRYRVMFAIFCAEQVVDLVREQDKEVCVKAIDTAKRLLKGEVSKEECRAATNAAYAAAYAASDAYACAAGYATVYAGGAACAADAAGCAAYAAACAANAYAFHADKNENKVIKEQWNYYNELLNLDENLEKILVG
jgi:hypothetical protein